MLNSLKKNGWWLVLIGLVLWLAFHVPSIQYGASDLPLYITHIGDEQVPVNGALHVLNEKNILALRDANKAYYGPIMVMLAVPATLLDYARVSLLEGVSSAVEYRNYVVWNWGGILTFGRILAVVTSFVGLVIFFRILLLPEINPKKYLLPAFLMTTLLATEYFYFHYTAQFRHWAFLNVILLSQLYLYFLLKRTGFQSWWYWGLQALLTITTFGISYLGALFNLVWATDIFRWLRNPKGHKSSLIRFSAYSVSVLVGAGLIVLWHPYAFFRLFGIVSSDLTKDTSSSVLEEDYGTSLSFNYYGELFLNNHLGIVIAGVFLLWLIWMSRKKITIGGYVIPVVILLVSYVLLFGLQSHHSTHYFLPAIVLVHLLVSILFIGVSNISKVGLNQFLWIAAAFFFGTQLAFNGAVIHKLLEVLRDGPPELTLAEHLISMQEREGGNVLLSGCGPIGVPHTREAYEDFAGRAERYKTNLYSTILSEGFPFPADVTLLDAYYDDNLPTGERLNSGQYDRVVLCNIFNAEDDPNKRLIFETRLLNYWNPEPFLTRYVLVNPDGSREVLVEGINFIK